MSAWGLLRPHGIILLVCCSCILQVKSEEKFYEETFWNNVTQGLIEDPITTITGLLVAQVAPATEFDKIPAIGWLQPPGTPQYRLKRCKRADIMNCTHAGNPKLPKQFQGAYWQEGITWFEVGTSHVCQCDGQEDGVRAPKDEEDGHSGHSEMANSYGAWNEKERHLTIETWKPKNWAAHDTSSRIAPASWYWLPSGAMQLNALATFQATCEVYLSEDNVNARILGTGLLLGFIRMGVPSWLADWTMKMDETGSWHRDSKVLGIPTPAANYILRPIVTGDLKPARFYPEWLKVLGGRDFFYIDDL